MNDRKSFEQWANTHYLLAELAWEIEDGEYREPEMQYAWEAWQASRESLVIELPNNVDGFDPVVCKMIEAIEAAGLKVKP